MEKLGFGFKEEQQSEREFYAQAEGENRGRLQGKFGFWGCRFVVMMQRLLGYLGY